ncbi:MFS general substrate transporter [Neoconidiobolus thromboides FSU 785]|nr:MFS general substrate transporter [Neoconidiobolus thromboides FSU 785]
MSSTDTQVNEAFAIQSNEKEIENQARVNQTNIDEPRVALSKTKFSLIILGLVLSIFVAALDNTIIATSLANITSDFNAFDEVTWVATSYLLSSTAFQPLYGKFSDIFGRRAVMLFALGIFLVGSVLCGAAQTIEMLIICRAIAGIGGGGLISLSVIIISDIVSLRRRGIFMGMVGANFAVASVVGPLIGGALTEKASWRWCFYINIPICLIAMFVIGFFLRLPTSKENMKEKLARVDYLGSITLLIFTSLIVLGLNWGGQQYPWNSAAVIVSLCLGIAFLLLFIFFQWKVSKEPIIPAHVLVRNVISADITAFFNGGVFFATIIYLPLYYQIVHQESAINSGLELLATMLGVVSMSIGSGIFMVKTGIYRQLSMVGTAIGIIGTALMGSLMRVDISRAELIVFSLLIGLGVGLCIQTNTIVSQAAVGMKDAAIVTSLVSFSQSLGGVIGIAVLGAVYQNVLTSSLVKNAPTVNIGALLQSSTYIQTLTPELRAAVVQSYVDGFHSMFLTGIAFFSISFIAALCLKHIPLRSMGPPAPQEPSK